MAPRDLLDNVLCIIDPLSGEQQSCSPLRKMRKWRAFVGIVCICAILHIMWNTGMLFGLPGVARADDVDRKILEVREAVQAQVREVDAKVQKVENKVDTLLKLSIEDRIRSLVQERCRSSESSVDRIQREIDSLQDEHERIAKARYPEPACRGPCRGP